RAGQGSATARRPTQRRRAHGHSRWGPIRSGAVPARKEKRPTKTKRDLAGAFRADGEGGERAQVECQRRGDCSGGRAARIQNNSRLTQPPLQAHPPHLSAASFSRSTRLTHPCNSLGSWFCNSI